jgi:hypothetical protein
MFNEFIQAQKAKCDIHSLVELVTKMIIMIEVVIVMKY